MDAVLGLSMTPTTVGLVLVEGQEADGATMDKDEFAVHDRGLVSAVNTSEKAAAAVLRTEAIAAARGHRLHSIGVTWSEDADTEASLLLESLSESGFDNVVAVRLPEATEALARESPASSATTSPPSASLSPTPSSCWWSIRPTALCRRRSTTPSPPTRISRAG